MHRFLRRCGQGRFFYAALLLLLSTGSGMAAAGEEVSLAGAVRMAPGRDWPAFLGPTSDGKSTETGILTTWDESGPPLLWHAAVGEGYAAPSISDGRLFLFDRHDNFMRLTALDAASGRELWRSQYATNYEDMYGFSNGPRAAPTIHGDLVYTHGAGGRIRCHQATTGDLVWEVDTVATFGVVQNFFGAGSVPMVEGDLLIAAVGGSPTDSPGIMSGKVTSNGSGIVAFDRRTGKVRYRSSEALASYSSPIFTTIGERRWGFLLARGGLLGFEPATGKIDFSFPFRARKLETVNAANPVLVNDTVFITESYGPGSAVLKVRPGGYEIIRQDTSPRNQSMSSHFMTPIYHEGYLYGSSGQGSGEAALRAVDYTSGKIMWSESGLGRTTLLYADGHLLVFTERGDLLLVKATPENFMVVARGTPILPGNRKPGLSGRPAGEKTSAQQQSDTTATPEARRLLRYPAWSPPVLSHGILYLRAEGRLAAFRLIPPAGS